MKYNLEIAHLIHKDIHHSRVSPVIWESILQGLICQKRFQFCTKQGHPFRARQYEKRTPLTLGRSSFSANFSLFYIEKFSLVAIIRYHHKQPCHKPRHRFYVEEDPHAHKVKEQFCHHYTAQCFHNSGNQ